MLRHFAPGIRGVDVRSAEALAACDALIIPGGESTAMRKIAKDVGLVDDLRSFVQSGKPVWGVCAGMIILCDHIQSEDFTIGGLDVQVVRNFFGRQSESSLRAMEVFGSAKGAGCSDVSHFIRAPALKSEQVGAGFEVLASVGANPVAVRKGSLLATAFHPEISGDSTWHSFFLRDVCGCRAVIPPTYLPTLGPNALCGDGLA